MLNEIYTASLSNSCSGAGYQAPPALMAGMLTSPILVIAQNPGEIKSDDTFRLGMGNAMQKLVQAPAIDPPTCAHALYNWYFTDFITSKGYARMSEVFGDDWLFNDFAFTNAVLCRTPGNEAPSSEMIATCATWTRIVAMRPTVKALVFIGKIAAKQHLGEKIDKLPPNTIKFHKESGKFLVYFPHYTIWQDKLIPDYRDTITSLRKAVFE